MASGNNPKFSTTNWSVVVAAAQADPHASRLALEKLCGRYWYPVYAFIRHQGNDVHEAEDLTQEFFHFVLENQTVAMARQEKGRFRTFLLTVLTNFLHNERDRTKAQKRGSRYRIISIDEQAAESFYALEARNGHEPEKLFERRWAAMLVQRVLAELGAEFNGRGKAALFTGIKPLLTGEPAAADYERLGAEFGMEAGAVKVALHRARRRFGELLRSEVANTVERPEDIEGELRHLMASLVN